MTSQDSPYFNLLRRLSHAGEREVFGNGDHDPRQKLFEELVRSIDHALGGDQVVYCTHSFTDLDVVNAPLAGRAIAFTPSLVATADLRSRPDLPVVVTPLNSLVAISIDDHRGPQFGGSTAWNGRRVSLRFDGWRNTGLLLPGGPSSDTNARDFADFYPSLLKALRT